MDRGLDAPLEAVGAQYLAELRTRARPRSVQEAGLALSRLERALGAERVRDLSRPSLLRWRQVQTQRGAANKTINNHVGYLKAALALCVHLGQIEASPLAGLRALPCGARHQRRRPRALSEWEIARLLAAAAAYDLELGGFPREPLIRALLLTGARWGEIIQATWGDLDASQATLTLRAETTKTGRARQVPIAPELLGALLALPGSERLAGRPIFLSPRGRPWGSHTGNFRKHLKACHARAGIVGVDSFCHGLRHSAATRLMRAGVPVKTTMLILGHATPSVLVGIYQHAGIEDARAAIASLPAIAKAV